MDGGASGVVAVPPEHADSGISMVTASAVWHNEDKYMGPFHERVRGQSRTTAQR